MSTLNKILAFAQILSILAVVAFGVSLTGVRASVTLSFGGVDPDVVMLASALRGMK